MSIGPSEAKVFWTPFLPSLMLRGLRGETGYPRHSRRAQGGDCEGPQGELAALPRALPAQRARLRQQEPAADGVRVDQHDLRAGGRPRRLTRNGASLSNSCERSSRARRNDGRRRVRRARVLECRRGLARPVPLFKRVRRLAALVSRPADWLPSRPSRIWLLPT